MKTCSTCAFIDHPTSQCRRFAPTDSTIAAHRLAEHKPWLACWPIVRAEDWCGDYKMNTGENTTAYIDVLPIPEDHP